MNRIKLVALIAMLPALAFAQGITGTRHDLALGAAGGGPKATANTQTCIFCHTPHKSATQALIWNHTLISTNGGVRGWTGVSTATGTSLPTAISAVSTRCLSCHDGTVGLGDVSNVGNGSAGTIVMSGNVTTGYLVGNGAVGNEMLNNHPVSIPYAGATYGTVGASGAITAGSFNYQAPTQTGCDTPSGWCTSYGSNGVRIYLYGTAAGNLGVECGSCHEVHNKYGGSYFLRASAGGSQICLTCHEK